MRCPNPECRKELNDMVESYLQLNRPLDNISCCAECLAELTDEHRHQVRRELGLENIDIAAWLNIKKVYIQDNNCNFELKFTRVTSSKISDILFVIEHELRKEPEERKIPYKALTKGKSEYFSFFPEKGGVYIARLILKYADSKGRPFIFNTTIPFKVHSSASSGIQSFALTLNNENNRGIIRENLGMEDILPFIKEGPKSSSFSQGVDEEFWWRINFDLDEDETQRQRDEIELKQVKPSTSGVITFDRPERRVYLFSKKSISLGRGPDNDIVTLVFPQTRWSEDGTKFVDSPDFYAEQFAPPYSASALSENLRRAGFNLPDLSDDVAGIEALNTFITQSDLYEMLQKHTNYAMQYDVTGSIGKRYRRQDEIGTPLCVTVDFDSLDDKKVTVRHRDSMAQERVAVDNLLNYINEQMNK